MIQCDYNAVHGTIKNLRSDSSVPDAWYCSINFYSILHTHMQLFSWDAYFYSGMPIHTVTIFGDAYVHLTPDVKNFFHDALTVIFAISIL